MTKKQYAKMDWEAIESIVYSDNDHPFFVLAPQKSGKDTLIQAFLPFAKKAEIIFEGKEDSPVAMDLVDEEGFYAAFVSGTVKAYCFNVRTVEGEQVKIRNPYDFAPVIPKDSFEEFKNGTCTDAYRVLGAHEMTLNGVNGVNFAVWAPNALRVSVVGAWNRWDGRVNPMQKLDEYGIFTLFIPEVKAGDVYRYEIKVKGNEILMKDDPYATLLDEEGRSVVDCEDEYKWSDEKFERMDGGKLRTQPVSVCQISLSEIISEASKGRKKLENALSDMIKFLAGQGYTHVSLMPVAARSKSKNMAYQTLFYYATDASLKEREVLKSFVNACHENGLSVLLDWSVAYFAKDANGLEWFDGSNLYEHADKRLGYQPAYDANVFQYQRPEVKSFLVSNACYWLAKYHFDGLTMRNLESVLYLDYGKTDWVCNAYGGKENLEFVSFIKELNAYIKKTYINRIVIADIDAVWADVTVKNKESLGFDLVWNNGFKKLLKDYVCTASMQRGNLLLKLLAGVEYAYNENFILPISEDIMKDGVIAELCGDDNDKAEIMKAVYAYTMLYPGKKLVYLDSKALMDAIGTKTKKKKSSYDFTLLNKDLNALYKNTGFLCAYDKKTGVFEWVNHEADVNNVITFICADSKEKEILYTVANFSDTNYDTLEVTVPFAGKYEACLSTASDVYGGPKAEAEKKVWVTAEKPYDETVNVLTLELKANSVTVFSYKPFTKKELADIAEHKRQLRIAYVKKERAKIEERRDAIIAEAIRDAQERIKELEKLLEEK